MSYDDAARALFQVPHGEFVAERKRLAAELKAAGDKLGASRISRLQRPPVTAWAVNQLYWHARDAVDALFALADRLRAGDLSATTAHREALAKLRMRAAAMLGDAGHGANEATLRRIALTLSAVAAAGTWMPDAPGQLSADRDPPGFDAVGVIVPPAAPLPTKTEPVKYDFDAPVSPMVVATAPPPPAPSEPKRNALAELAAKRKAMAEEEKLRKAAEKRGEEYVPPDPKPASNAPASSKTTTSPPGTTSTVSSSPPPRTRLASVPPMARDGISDKDSDSKDTDSNDDDSNHDESKDENTAPITPRRRLSSVPPISTGDSNADDGSNEGDDSNDDEDDDSNDDDKDEAPVTSPRARTLSIVPPLPADESDDDESDDDIDTPTASNDSNNDDESDEDDSDDDESDDDDSADEVEAPQPATPKLSALEQLRLRKKQQAEEAEEERRRRFIEDGGTKDRVIAKRMMEAQERNRESTDAKRERVESAVRAKLDAQRANDAQRASTEVKQLTSDNDDNDDEDLDEDDTDAPALTVQTGGRIDGPKGPPQATDLVSALAAKLGVQPSAKPSTAATPARPATPAASSNLSTGASPARGTPGARPATPASTNLSTGASPARHVPENTKPPGSFPRPRTPSPSSLAPSTPARTEPPARSSAGPSTSASKPAPMTDPERRKIEARAKLKAELETRLRAANAEVLAAEQRVEKLTAELADADDALEAARAAVEDVRDKLDALD